MRTLEPDALNKVPFSSSPRSGRAPRAVAIASVVLLALAACGVDQQVTLRIDGSGNTSLAVSLDPSFVDYLRALAELGGGDLLPQDSIFDLEKIEQAVAALPGVRLTALSAPQPNELLLELTFQDIVAAFAVDDPGDDDVTPPLVSMSAGRGADKDGRTFRLHLDAGNYNQLSRLFPALENPLIASLGPQPQLPMTDSEYLEMMQFALGDAAPKQIAESSVTIDVAVEGSVVSQVGGELTDAGVRFRIPLIRILVLDRPLQYTVTFR